MKSEEWPVAGSRRNPESNSAIVFWGIGLYQNFNGGYVFNSNWTANANHGPFYLNNNSTSNTNSSLGFRLATISYAQKFCGKVRKSRRRYNWDWCPSSNKGKQTKGIARLVRLKRKAKTRRY